MRVTIFGYGAVGLDLAARLVARGDAVRAVQRHAPAQTPPGVEFASADVLDADAVRTACSGAGAVVCAIGVPYDSAQWERVWPTAIRNLLDACAATGARFVLADNLYMYGPQDRPLKEDLPLTDFGRKPRLRSEVTRLWLRAHEAGRVRATAVRAADFYGPGVATSVISTFGVANLVKGKAAISPFPADHPHDFTYVPDFAAALETLVYAPDDAYGRAWHAPNAGPTRSLREALRLAAEIANVPFKLTVLPGWAAPLMGLFQPAIRELQEMRFQWDRPYRVDDSDFRARFGAEPTPFEQGLAETVRYYRAG